jgi:hypothetical protein
VMQPVAAFAPSALGEVEQHAIDGVCALPGKRGVVPANHSERCLEPADDVEAEVIGHKARGGRCVAGGGVHARFAERTGTRAAPRSIAVSSVGRARGTCPLRVRGQNPTAATQTTPAREAGPRRHQHRRQATASGRRTRRASGAHRQRVTSATGRAAATGVITRRGRPRGTHGPIAIGLTNPPTWCKPGRWVAD